MYADKAITVVLDAPANKVEMQRARLLQDGYKWRAMVANPKEYGRDGSQVTVNVSLGALHLDALRKVSATATLSREATVPKLTSGNELDVEDADTVEEADG